MSRVGKAPINLPAGITVDIKGTKVSVKGPKGELSENIHPDMIVKIEDGVLVVDRPTEQKRHKAMHGLYRSLINNMVVGVSEGYRKDLELVGVGYKAESKDNILELNLGFSHNIFMAMPKEVEVTAETLKGQNPKVSVIGIDKQLVGTIAAKIKSFRTVEPYKGKGIRFVGEQIRRKAGKTAAK